eukprot:TRINITY_DN7766_c0_g1_i1.p1 TRINITY_DN7766_c0_g1~~TRINITY_DN7766_c0_g1_i1.p1  ORF type:complete len:203 (+),score=53.23 TRINITY_DN7766_c0_g1_i1:150-758(+)
MRPTLRLALPVLLLALSAADQPVIVLTEADFHAQTSQGAWIVKFYAPWCGACKQMAPIYSQLPAQLPGLKVAKVDIDDSKALAREFGVTGIPALKFIADGKTVGTYKGGAVLAELKAFAQAHTPASTRHTSSSDGGAALHSAIHAYPIVCVAAAFASGLVIGALAGATIALREKEQMPNTPTWMARQGAAPVADAQPHAHAD